MTWMEAWQACQKLGFTLNRTNSGRYLIRQQDAWSLKGLSLLVSDLEDAVAQARSLREIITKANQAIYNEVSADVEWAFDEMRKQEGLYTRILTENGGFDWVRPSSYIVN